MKSKPNDRGEIEKQSAGTQTMKEEPKEIGVVNVASSSPAVKTGVKRANSSQNEHQRTAAKRKKTSKSDSNSRITRRSTAKFICEYCLDDWGREIMHSHRGNPDESDAPHPKHMISTFSNIKSYQDHLVSAHFFSWDNFCNEKNCKEYKDHGKRYNPHGDIICKICSVSFKNHEDHEEHLQVGHIDFNNKKQIYQIYVKYN